MSREPYHSEGTDGNINTAVLDYCCVCVPSPRVGNNHDDAHSAADILGCKFHLQLLIECFIDVGQ